MTNTLENTAEQTTNDQGYSELLNQLGENWAGQQLFQTDVTNLFDTFLTFLPPEDRQHYTCNSCRNFVNTYGGLVTIDAAGIAASAIWPVSVPDFFKPSVDAMRRAIKNADVTGVFYSSEEVFGKPINSFSKLDESGNTVTGEWHHFAVKPLARTIWRHNTKSADQEMAEKLQDKGVLERSLQEFPLAIVDKALTILRAGSLYRSATIIGSAEWFRDLIASLASQKSAKIKANLIWAAVASAPNGFCNVRNNMLGTLLTDIAAELPFITISHRFEDKMRGYQRSEVAPTLGAVHQASKLIEDLGLVESLERRYASPDEIPSFVWKERGAATKPQPTGVFSGVATKEKAKPEGSTLALSLKTMTWRKFSETVLPSASKIEVKVENSNRMAALVAPVHPESPTIFQWENGFSWYYHGGVDAEIKRRVEGAGGKHENNEIRASLIWENYSDLDLHAEGPGGHIFYGEKRDRFGGFLDIDMNAGRGTTMTPVENIRWATAPAGLYRFYINNYSERADRRNAYKAEIEIAGNVYTFQGVIGGTGSQVDLAKFQYKKGVAPSIAGSAVSSGSAWNLTMNQFYPVAGIVKSPNLWGKEPVTHAGDHTFFLIEGCKDTAEGLGRGFFNEMLRSDLREIRKTLEAYTATAKIAGGDNQTACGLGYSSDGDWDLTVRVTANNTVAMYKIDRFD